jgi:hypothetical protein
LAEPDTVLVPDSLPAMVDTTPVDTAASPEDTSPPEDLEETTAPDIPFNPLDHDPSPPFLPPTPPPPSPITCLPLVNAGAESGSTSGWTSRQGAFRAQSDTSVFEGDYPVAYAGSWYFAGGMAAESRLSQDVALPESPSAPARYALLTGILASDSGRDAAYLALEALDGAAAPVARAENGPYRDESWRTGVVSLALPAATRSLRVELRAVRGDDLENDAFFDDLTLCVYGERPRPAEDELLAPPYLMNPTPTSVSVLFETRKPTRARVDFGTSPTALDRTVEEASATTTHLLRLTNLTPSTRYYYRVSHQDLALPTWDFVTARAPEDSARVEFVMVGDNQDGPATFQGLAEQMAALDPDFILHAGDCVQNGQRKDYRESFFAPLAGLGNHAPLVLAQGNHETYESGVFTSSASRALWTEYVDQPGDEHCFGLRWGSVFVLVINTEDILRPGFPQFACVEEALRSEAALTATFRTALFHRPPLVEFWDSEANLPSDVTFFTFQMDAPDVRTYLAPLFEASQVDLVFNGHNHLYQFVPAWPSRVSWVTSGGGGGRLESGIPESRVNDWAPFVGNQVIGSHHFLHVIVERGVMSVRAIAEGGRTIDWFELRRPAP